MQFKILFQHLKKIIAWQLPNFGRLDRHYTSRIGKFADQGRLAKTFSRIKNTLNKFLSLLTYTVHLNRPGFYLKIIGSLISLMTQYLLLSQIHQLGVVLF